MPDCKTDHYHLIRNTLASFSQLFNCSGCKHVACFWMRVYTFFSSPSGLWFGGKKPRIGSGLAFSPKLFVVHTTSNVT